MTPDETNPAFAPAEAVATEATPEDDECCAGVLSFSAIQGIEGDDLAANGCAIGSAHVGNLEAVGSIVGIATAESDFVSRFSIQPLTYAKGDATLSQSYTSAFVAGGTVNMSQALAPVVAGRTVTISQGGSGAVVAGDVSVERGAVGVLLAGRAQLSDDTRVLIGTRGALIIAAVLLGGFGLLALAGFFGARKLAEWRPIDVDLMAERFPWLTRL